MKYREIKPIGFLTNFIQSFWEYETFSTEFEQEVIKAVREIVKDILQDEIKQDKRYNQTELCENLGIGLETLSDLNRRGLRPTKVGRQYIYLESEVNKFLRENTI